MDFAGASLRNSSNFLPNNLRRLVCGDGKVPCKGVLPWSGVTSDESLALLLFASGAEASCVLVRQSNLGQTRMVQMQSSANKSSWINMVHYGPCNSSPGIRKVAQFSKQHVTWRYIFPLSTCKRVATCNHDAFRRLHAACIDTLFFVSFYVFHWSWRTLKTMEKIWLAVPQKDNQRIIKDTSFMLILMSWSTEPQWRQWPKKGSRWALFSTWPGAML